MLKITTESIDGASQSLRDWTQKTLGALTTQGSEDQIILIECDDHMANCPSWDREEVQCMANIFTSLLSHPSPVITLVKGDVFGEFFGFIAVADICIAGKRALFSPIGKLPAAAYPFITRRIGAARAKQLAARSLDAEEAIKWGLVDDICDDVDKKAEQYIKRLMKMDSRSIRAIKQLGSTYWPIPKEYDEESILLQKGM